MTRWRYPDTDEWKKWVQESQLDDLESWHQDYHDFMIKKNKIEMKNVGLSLLLVLIGFPLMIEGFIIHPFVGLVISIIDFVVIGYIFYLFYKGYALSADYDNGYPQSLAHPKKIYREIQVRKKQENMDYDCMALGLKETIQFVKKRNG